MYIAFWHIREVFDPSKLAKEIERPAPENMVAWLQKHPYLNTASPKLATVGGVEGEQFDKFETAAHKVLDTVGWEGA